MVESVQSTDGTTITYETAGSGPVLILVGGAMNTRHSAGDLVPLLAEDFSVITFDRRGRGESTNTPPYAVEREVEDFQALVAGVGGSACVYGHSSGGILALEAAAAGVEISKLAVYEPPYATSEGDDGLWQVFVDKVQSLVDEGHSDQAVEEFIRHTGAGFDERMKQSPWWPAMVALAPTLPYDLALAADGVVPVERLGRISAPVLALYGGASAAWAETATAEVSMAVQNGRQDVIEGQTHAAAPDSVAPTLLQFFH
ncbi:alpha/beta hydrolase [Paenarthrobacter sp. Z7-10]|uniref:alpha/beta fold hydrolase n=1 Tax=Paenarthrobacter sp. Z7-10 TaxID=2787635 RepID=UPI0022A9B811|nr:alpha/beta hydrolase [Paenarthrobacter sp. Z7-10]MCZ2402001.1 alpha/beta hydrolase [Paenarthrobacter sp. Z7-10]